MPWFVNILSFEEMHNLEARRDDKLKDRLRWLGYVLCPSIDALVDRSESMVHVVKWGRGRPKVTFTEFVSENLQFFGIHADLQNIG